MLPTDGQEIDQPTIRSESDHFLFQFFEQDIDVIDDIISILEENYERVTSALQVELPSKSDVIIYPDLESFHRALGRPNLPDWVVGVFYDGAIIMVSPNNPGPAHSYESIIKVAVHEFVHLAAAQINRSVPAYLGEGLAVYMAGQSEMTGLEDIIGGAIMQSAFPTISELWSLSGGDNLYQFGYALVEYIVGRYGWDGVLRIYKSPDIPTVFDISEDEFYEQWILYLRNTYSAE